MNNKDVYYVKEMIGRTFQGIVETAEIDDEEIEEVLKKCQDVLIEIIAKELTEQEKFHYVQACKHSIEMMSKERFSDFNKTVYNGILESLSEL